MDGKQISWPQALVVIAIIAGVVTLSILGRDLSSLAAIGIAIFGAIGLGVGKAQSIEAKVNGNLATVLAQNAEQARMLAAAHVPPAALAPPPAAEQPPPGTTSTAG